MKQGRRLYRNEKEILRKHHLNPEDYSFLGDCLDTDGRPGAYFKVQNKTTGNIKIISKF